VIFFQIPNKTGFFGFHLLLEPLSEANLLYLAKKPDSSSLPGRHLHTPQEGKMKKSKLSLRKVTLSRLENSMMNELQGGWSVDPDICCSSCDYAIFNLTDTDTAWDPNSANSCVPMSAWVSICQ